jgi:hypothetical protein
MIYTPNTIKKLNKGIRKHTKTKWQFPDGKSIKNQFIGPVKTTKNSRQNLLIKQY